MPERVTSSDVRQAGIVLCNNLRETTGRLGLHVRKGSSTYWLSDMVDGTSGVSDVAYLGQTKREAYLTLSAMDDAVRFAARYVAEGVQG